MTLTQGQNNNQLKRRHRNNEIIVNTKSKFTCHLMRCQAIMDNIHTEELVLKGIGKATTRALNLALQLNSNNFNTFAIIPETKCVEFLQDKQKQPIKGHKRDEYDPDKIDQGGKRIVRIPAIEITVRKNQLELDKMSLLKRQAKEYKLKS